MKNKPILRLVPAVAVAVALGACRAEVRDEGEPPEIDIEEGRAPDIDVEPADVEITTDTQQVVVPDINVEERDTVR